VKSRFPKLLKISKFGTENEAGFGADRYAPKTMRRLVVVSESSVGAYAPTGTQCPVANCGSAVFLA
jgi:hypothetical protein